MSTETLAALMTVLGALLFIVLIFYFTDSM
jgi:hypothetical protein